MVKMIALKSFPYAGKRLKVGAEFEARTGSDARLLAAIKNAVEAPTAPEAPPAAPQPTSRTYHRRDMLAPEAVELVGSADGEPVKIDKPKRTYRRRDLVAEK